MTGVHHGAVILARNADATRFLVQQKDADYRPHPCGYSLFGGAVEADERVESALARELVEELGAQPAALLLAAGPVHFADYALPGARLSLFEVTVTDAILDRLAATPVLEGERAVVIGVEQLRTLPFIWQLPLVLADYLARRGPGVCV